MVDTVSKPELLEVLLEGYKLLALTNIQCGVDALQGAADSEVVLEVLIPENITTTLCCLREVVDKLLLLKRKLLEAGNLVAQYLDVVETIDNPRCLLLLLSLATSGEGQSAESDDT